MPKKKDKNISLTPSYADQGGGTQGAQDAQDAGSPSQSPAPKSSAPISTANPQVTNATRPEGAEGTPYKQTSDIGKPVDSKPSAPKAPGTRELPSGAAVRQGPNGPMHRHPGYPAGATGKGGSVPMKWHPVSQKHGSDRATMQMHQQAGLGKDGLGGNAAMRQSVGANMDLGGGLIQAPKEGMMGTAAGTLAGTAGKYAGLALLEGFAHAGDAFSLAGRFMDAVLSGKPLSPASTLLAGTLDGMGQVSQSLSTVNQRYGIDPGVDLAAVKDTVRGGAAQRERDALNAGYTRACDTVDQLAHDITAGGDITNMGPAQLKLFYDGIDRRANEAIAELNAIRERGGDRQREKELKAELQMYGAAFGAIQDRAEYNEKSYRETAKILRAERAMQSQMETEQRKAEKAEREAWKEERFEQASPAERILLGFGDRYYDEELTDGKVPINATVRQRYERALSDKLKGNEATLAEIESILPYVTDDRRRAQLEEQRRTINAERQGLQDALERSREYSKTSEQFDKIDARNKRINFDYGAPDLNIAVMTLRDANALNSPHTDRFGTVGGDKMSPRIFKSGMRSVRERGQALFAKEKARLSDEYQRMNGRPPEGDALREIESKARSFAENDKEYRRGLAFADLQNDRRMQDLLLTKLNDVSLSKLQALGLDEEDRGQAMALVQSKYEEYGERFGFLDDEDGEWDGEVQTDEDRAQYREFMEDIRRTFGIDPIPNIEDEETGLTERERKSLARALGDDSLDTSDPYIQALAANIRLMGKMNGSIASPKQSDAKRLEAELPIRIQQARDKGDGDTANALSKYLAFVQRDAIYTNLLHNADRMGLDRDALQASYADFRLNGDGAAWRTRDGEAPAVLDGAGRQEFTDNLLRRIGAGREKAPPEDEDEAEDTVIDETPEEIPRETPDEAVPLRQRWQGMGSEERVGAVSDGALDADIPELREALEQRSPGFKERPDDAMRAIQTLFPKGYNPADHDAMDRATDAMLVEQGRMRNLLHELGMTEHDGADVASNPDINPLIFARNELNTLERAEDSELSDDERMVRDALGMRLARVEKVMQDAVTEVAEEPETIDTGMERPGGEEVVETPEDTADKTPEEAVSEDDEVAEGTPDRDGIGSFLSPEATELARRVKDVDLDGLAPEVRDEVSERTGFYAENLGQMLIPRDDERAKDLSDEDYLEAVSRLGVAALGGHIKAGDDADVQKTIDAYWKGLAKLVGVL